MNVQVELTEAQLRFGVLKLALSLAMVFVIVAVGMSWLAGWGQGLAVSVLFVCVAFGFFANGVLAVLKIVDWIEARRAHRG